MKKWIFAMIFVLAALYSMTVWAFDVDVFIDIRSGECVDVPLGTVTNTADISLGAAFVPKKNGNYSASLMNQNNDTICSATSIWSPLQCYQARVPSGQYHAHVCVLSGGKNSFEVMADIIQH